MIQRQHKIIVRASKRFNKAYSSASLLIKNFAEGAVHDLLRRIESDPRTVLSQYGRLKQCKGKVLEVDICGAYRIIAEYSEDVLILLDLGDHEVVPRYDDKKRVVDMATVELAPACFFSTSQSEFFKRNPDKTITIGYAEEVTDDWLYFLTNEQQQVVEDIVLELFENDSCSSIIVGGPGTGKTCILLNLLRELAGDYQVGIHISRVVAEYAESVTGANISVYRHSCFNTGTLDVLLVDDPSYDEIKAAISAMKSGAVRSLVFAFDPLQLNEPLADEDFNKIKYDGDFDLYRLTECYRQKANLGENTKHVVDAIAESTPFLASEKIVDHKNRYKKMTEFSNNLSFPNPAGYLEVFPEANGLDVLNEFVRLIETPGFRKRKNGLLIVYDDDRLLAHMSEHVLNAEYIRVVPLSNVRSIKGLEFQHAFVFITSELFHQIQNGFVGCGRAVYNQRRLLRIPFSRAKDSCVTFAFDNLES